MQCRKSDRNGVAHVDQNRVEGLGHFECFIHRVVHQLLALHADDAVILALLQQANCLIAHGRSIHAVAQGGRTATLHMTQNGCAGIDAGACLDLVGDLLCMTHALGHDDDKVALAGLLGFGDLIQNVALHIEFLLGQQHSHSAGGDGHVQRNVTAVSGAFMAVSGENFFSFGMFDETLSGVGWDTEFCVRLMRKGLANCFTPFAKARLSGGLPNDYANAGKANLLRCYDVYRETLLFGDRYFNPNFDYANPVPTLAAVPYPPIKLNPLYSG